MIETQNNTEVQTEQHAGPHIPKIQWETVYGPISNTNVATFIFLILVAIFAVFAKSALKKEKSRLKTAILDVISLLDKNLTESFHGEKKFSRAVFPLIAGFFIIILFWNILWLVIDWLGSSISPNILEYVRPINSDLNTTLVLALITVITFLGIALKTSGVGWFTKWYLFNFTGNGLAEKCINVIVGWLHLLSVPATVASLSLRLFWNIFAGVILLWVITYLWVLMSSSFFEVGRLLSVPFWFFELLIAWIQAAVFYMLMISYFNQSKESHH